MKIFVNAATTHQGGGKTILINLISNIANDKTNDYIFLVDDLNSYKKYEKSNVKIITLNKLFLKQIILPVTFLLVIPYILKKNKVDRVFNLSDIPIFTSKYQVFYFDWAFLVYPEEYVYLNMGRKDLFRIRVKKYFFNKGFKFIDKLILQTSVIEKRMINKYEEYDFKSKVVPIGKPALTKNGEFDLNVKELKFLCLTNYYAHKNLEILIEAAKIIKEKKYKVKIILTLDSKNKSAKDLLDKIEKNKLQDILMNIGTVKYDDLYSLYEKIDVSILPTLIESYSGTYVESIMFNKPVLTSDFDFSRNLCENCALYFNPFSAESIVNSITEVMNEKVYREISENCKDYVIKLKNWQQITNELIKEIHE